MNKSQNKPNLNISILEDLTKTQYVVISVVPMYICVWIGVGYPHLLGKKK